MLTKVSIHDFLYGTKVMDADLRRHDAEVETAVMGPVMLGGTTDAGRQFTAPS